MDYRRARVPGGTYFFTLVTAHRQPLLVKKIDRLREAFRLVKRRHPSLPAMESEAKAGSPR